MPLHFWVTTADQSVRRNGVRLRGETGWSERSICIWASGCDCPLENWSQESVPTELDFYRADFTHSWPESSTLIDRPAPDWVETHYRASRRFSLLDTLKGVCTAANSALGQVVVLLMS